MSTTPLQGSMVALATPMNQDGSLNWDQLKRLVEWHIAEGTDAIVAMGTTGESATLSMDEHKAVMKFVIEQVAGRIPVIAGTGQNATSETIELTEFAKAAGADACLLVCPYYNKPTQEGLYQHHVAVAEAVDIPQILYNVPARTAVDMLPETVLRLAAVDNIIGIKEATGDMARAEQLINEAPEGFLVISGDDETALDLVLLGGRGSISVTANVAPRLVAQSMAAALAGDETVARELYAKLDGLNKALFFESNPIPVKWALHLMGYASEGIRLPLTPLAEVYRAPLVDAMRAADIELN